MLVPGNVPGKVGREGRFAFRSQQQFQVLLQIENAVCFPSSRACRASGQFRLLKCDSARDWAGVSIQARSFCRQSLIQAIERRSGFTVFRE